MSADVICNILMFDITFSGNRVTSVIVKCFGGNCLLRFTLTECGSHSAFCLLKLDSNSNAMAHGDAWVGEVKGKLANGVGS